MYAWRLSDSTLRLHFPSLVASCFIVRWQGRWKRRWGRRGLESPPVFKSHLSHICSQYLSIMTLFPWLDTWWRCGNWVRTMLTTYIDIWYDIFCWKNTRYMHMLHALCSTWWMWKVGHGFGLLPARLMRMRAPTKTNRVLSGPLEDRHVALPQIPWLPNIQSGYGVIRRGRRHQPPRHGCLKRMNLATIILYSKTQWQFNIKNETVEVLETNMNNIWATCRVLLGLCSGWVEIFSVWRNPRKKTPVNQMMMKMRICPRPLDSQAWIKDSHYAALECIVIIWIYLIYYL